MNRPVPMWFFDLVRWANEYQPLALEPELPDDAWLRVSYRVRAAIVREAASGLPKTEAEERALCENMAYELEAMNGHEVSKIAKRAAETTDFQWRSRITELTGFKCAQLAGKESVSSAADYATIVWADNAYEAHEGDSGRCQSAARLIEEIKRIVAEETGAASDLSGDPMALPPGFEWVDLGIEDGLPRVVCEHGGEVAYTSYDFHGRPSAFVGGTHEAVFLCLSDAHEWIALMLREKYGKR